MAYRPPHKLELTERLDGSPNRAPAQQVSRSPRAAPPMVVTSVPPRSYTRTMASDGVVYDTAISVVDAATAYGLSRPTTQSCGDNTVTLRHGHGKTTRDTRKSAYSSSAP